MNIIPNEYTVQQMVQQYRSEKVVLPDDRIQDLSSIYLTDNLNAIINDLYLLREKVDSHFLELRKKEGRGQVNLEPEFSRRLAKYPLGCCLEITRQTLAFVQQEIHSSTYESMHWFRSFGNNGGFIRRVWGSLRGEYFQNAIQAGSFYIDVANDTVDPSKEKIEVLPFEVSGFNSINSYAQFVSVAESYWRCQMIPNIFFLELAPFFPIILFHEDGHVLLESNNVYMFSMNLESKYNLALDYVLSCDLESAKFCELRGKLNNVERSLREKIGTSFGPYTSVFDKEKLLKSFTAFQNLNDRDLDLKVKNVLNKNLLIGRC